MSLRDEMIQVAHENPTLRAHLVPLLRAASQGKSAGGFSWSLLGGGKPEVLVSTAQIKGAMTKAGFDLTVFDFSKIEFDTVDKGAQSQPGFSHTLEAIWRVFPTGQFGKRESDYVWGTVVVGLNSAPQGLRVMAHIYVKT